MENHKHLKINMISLTAMGVWKLKFNKDQRTLKMVYTVYGYIVQSYFALFTISQLIQLLYIFIDGNVDLDEILDNTSVSLLYSVVVVKMVICNSKGAVKLINQIKSIEEKLYRFNDEKHIKIFEEHMKYNHFIDNFFLIFGVFTITPFFVTPVIKIYNNPEAYQSTNEAMYPERPLPFSSWFPFDKYKHYYLAYGMQMVAGTYGCNYVVCTDIFFFALMIFAMGQAKILRVMMMEFRKKALEEAKGGNEELIERAVCRVVRECVLEHKTLIGFVKDLDSLMKFVMFLDFGICSIQMAVLGFQVIVAGFSIKQLFALEFLASMLTQLFLFYWHANEIILESKGIAQSIWESEWYECSPKIKKSLHIMMMRAQRPLTLSVGPFYVMSTETALGILRAAYSYVTLLRQSYMRKEEMY